MLCFTLLSPLLGNRVTFILFCVGVLPLALGTPTDESTQEQVRRIALKLKDENPVVRSSAAFDLERLGPAAKAAVPALLEALRDREGVGHDAAAALLVIDPDNRQGIRLLVKDLAHRRTDVRYNAASVLGIFGAKGRAALPALVSTLQDPERDVRLAAACSLHDIQPGHPAAVRVLAAVVLDGQDEKYLPILARAAKVIFGPLVTGRVGPELPTTLRHCYFDLLIEQWNISTQRQFAVWRLGSMGQAAGAAAPVLRAALSDGERGIRESAAEALKSIEGKGASP
jgi:HEAT repeat protein